MIGLSGHARLGNDGGRDLDAGPNAFRLADRFGMTLRDLGGDSFVHASGCVDNAGVYRAECVETDSLLVLMVRESLKSDRHEIDAGTVARICEKDGVSALNGLTGSYQLLVRNLREGWLILQADRQATLPLFYRISPVGILFSTSAQGIFAMSDGAPELDVAGAVSFLREGFPLARQSLFADVKRMAPGARLWASSVTRACRVEDYWRLKFRPQKLQSLPDAAERLFGGSKQAHLKATEGFEDKFGLFLTGGIDSRGMAGVLAELRLCPSSCLTWCGQERVPLSDPDIAGQIARYYGYPHRVVPLNADSLPENARDWLRIGELTTDNLGFFTSPADIFSVGNEPKPAFYLVGDEFFGHGGVPYSTEEAIAYVLKSSNSRGSVWSRGCLRDAEHVEELYRVEMRSYLDPALGLHPRDLVDWLTYYIHRPCWSFSAGNCKLPALPVRRPFMDDKIVELVARLPREFRSDKVVYHEMLRRHLPRALRFPRASADSLFDWPRRFRTHAPTRNFLLNAIQHEALLTGPLAPMLDPDRILAFADSYFEESPPRPASRRTFGHVAVNIRRALQRRPLTRPFARKISGWMRRPRVEERLGSTHLVRRLALMSLFIQELESGGFSGRPGS